MKFRIENWSVRDLLKKYDQGKIDLNPPYQRKFIWSLTDQCELIRSLKRGLAIPSIFLFENGDKFQMVDGQQRTRTILSYLNGGFKDNDGKLYDPGNDSFILDFKIPVTVIEELEGTETIEEFYALVNKTGVHLNRPELRKAEFFDTNFLKLVTNLADDNKFQELKLFSDLTSKRMNDVDFVSELVTLMKFGITDKKQKVDDLFKEDISQSEYLKLEQEFNEVISVFSRFNSIKPLKLTRYKQRNDFYSIFDLIYHGKRTNDFWDYVYKLLVVFNDYIIPSNTDCEPFQEYAFNCISQSNSKAARDKRSKILNNLFLNGTQRTNSDQRRVLKYFSLSISDMIEFEGCKIFDLNKINSSS